MPNAAAGVALSLAMGAVGWFALAARNARRPISKRAWLVGLFAVGLALRMAFVVGTPVFQAPDEQPHYNYVRYVVDHHRLPVQHSRTGAPTYDWEYYQPPLYYLVGAPVLAAADRIAPHSTALKVRSLRLVSVALWCALFLIVAAGCRSLGADDVAASVPGLALVAFLPTLAFISSSINNDNLVNVLTPAAIVAAAGAASWRRAVLVGVLAGCAVLAKLSAVAAAPMVVAGFFAAARRGRSGRASAALCASAGAVAAVLSAPMFLRNLHEYRSLTAESVANVPIAGALDTRVRFALSGVRQSFWAVSGRTNNIRFAEAAELATALAVIGVVLLVARWRREGLGRRGRVLAVGAGAAFALGAALVLRFGVLYGQAQGRFLYPLLLPLAVAFGLGCREIGRRLRIADIHVHVVGALGVFSAAFATFTVYTLRSLPH